ncbi:TPA: nitroreductase [Candidatus Dependentiae bacterium]|nr:MAG: Nitroreductase [candidate division TM6 bacterium GW2011_GWE2_31_21]KKP53001.1 MAG: Nitroreductase [candidate division TM6 bacterium GW2011_GWF2_33_332]HBS47762.1 nitroreductase [Candidatus Dependentiae bacterium]HBZ73262.1 nitroreductase [Candidatus Dependentiae bacterium]
MNSRKPEYKISPIILNRWSSRAMSGEEITNDELMSLFEAAKWAQSSYNAQPWRFIYAKRNSKNWQNFFDLLIPFNQGWCKNAAVLIIVVSRKNFEFNDKFSVTHSFDTGAACENMALQGSINGLVVHAMGSFDYEGAAKAINLPDKFEVNAMFAIGKPGKVEDLPKEMQEREVMSDRKKLKEIVFEGEFSK